jgi:hypothetical protein
MVEELWGKRNRRNYGRNTGKYCLKWRRFLEKIQEMEDIFGGNKCDGILGRKYVLHSEHCSIV